MAQGFVLASPRLRYWDSNGAILALGKLYFYAAGTSTPQNTWQDSGLTSLNTNPITLSASGECTVFVPQGNLYKIDLFDANGVHQAGFPLDGVEAIPAPDPPAPTPSPIPTGGIFMYGGTSAPSGYLMVDGALVSRTTYAALYAVIGTTFGAGDGMTTFGLPDMRQRFPLGKATSGTGSTLGETGGLIDHTHTGPSHTHFTEVGPIAHTHSIAASSHTHTVAAPRGGWSPTSNAPSVSGRIVLGDGAATFTQPTADVTVTSGTPSDSQLITGSTDPTGGGVSVTSSASGTGATGSANPSFQSVNFLIKT